MKIITKMNPKFSSKLLFVFSLILMSGCQHFQEDTAPSGLMTDLLLNTEEAVITNPEPGFSWIVNGSGDGVMQTAYQIMVASDPDLIENDDPDVWNSEKVDSDESIAIPYNGNSLN